MATVPRMQPQALPSIPTPVTSFTNLPLVRNYLFRPTNSIVVTPLKPRGVFYVPPGLTFKNSTWRQFCDECFVSISEQTVTFALYIIKWLVL